MKISANLSKYESNHIQTIRPRRLPDKNIMIRYVSVTTIMAGWPLVPTGSRYQISELRDSTSGSLIFPFPYLPNPRRFFSSLDSKSCVSLPNTARFPRKSYACYRSTTPKAIAFYCFRQTDTRKWVCAGWSVWVSMWMSESRRMRQ